MVTTPAINLTFEETVFTDNQQIVSRTFPDLALTVEQVFAAGNLTSVLI